METRNYTGQNQSRPNGRSLWSKTWRDRQGKIVIWQMPNLPLIAWAGLTVLSLMVNGRLADICSWLGSAALITWSLLEIFQGVNYFRRALGTVVLAVALASLIKSL